MSARKCGVDCLDWIGCTLRPKAHLVFISNPFWCPRNTVADFCAECGKVNCAMSPRSRITCVNLKFDQWFDNDIIQIQKEEVSE